MAEFCFNGAKVTGFTTMSTILSGALNGQFKGFDADGLKLIAAISAGLAIVSIILLVNGWVVAGKDEKDAKSKSATRSPTVSEPKPAFERNDIILYSPAERDDDAVGVRVSMRASGAKRIAVAMSIDQGN